MGCGGSKDKLTGADKPLDHWMEALEMETIDANFQRASGIITTIEEKRRQVINDLESVYESSGAIAYKNRDLSKALKCVIWKLGVDNDGNVAKIGFNFEDMTFGGAKNSTHGNEAGEKLIKYCKNILENWKPEDLTCILTEIEEIYKDFNGNMDRYTKEIQEKCTSNPFDAIKKMIKLKGNISKCTDAVVCLKDLIERLKMHAVSAPQVMASLNPVTMLKEAPHVEKAFKLRITDAVQIAWNIIEPHERQGKTWKDCVKEAEEKTKKRQKYFDEQAKKHEQANKHDQAKEHEKAKEPEKKDEE